MAERRCPAFTLASRLLEVDLDLDLISSFGFMGRAGLRKGRCVSVVKSLRGFACEYIIRNLGMGNKPQEKGRRRKGGKFIMPVASPFC
jgi:hypothetical protein